MSRFRLSWMVALLFAVALVACGGPRATQMPTTAPAAPATATPPPAPTAAPPTPAPTAAVLEAPVANLTEGCVTDYDPDLDYFPEKVTLEDATGWTIEYFNNYKLITVLNPWRDADVQFRYVLVQCGTPAPPDVGNAQMIEVPVKSIVTMSTTQLPHLKELDLLDRLVGVDTFQYINTPEVVELIEAGKLKEIGSGAELNVEQAIDIEPDLVMTYGVGNPEFDSHPKLLEAGLKVAMNAEYMEPPPLGRAEWIKFTAAFFNREAMATEVYADIAGRYAEMTAKAQAVTMQPTVFSGAPFRGTWYMPGGNSYAAKLLADAGAAYLWADDTSTGSMQLSFEEVLDRAKDADIWVNPGSWKTLAEGLAQDERFAQFLAFQNGEVYNNNRRLNANGGNDYWETGVTNPDLVLADLIAIFHPELLPGHEFVFYQRLE
ncbi:MAG: ABC transporter substrate-binding protein [Chloroflexaceae bacterium]